MATYLVTGAAGFIGAKVAELLRSEGHAVVGVDNLNDYYDVKLKDWRLAKLQAAGGGRFTFHHLDIENFPALEEIFKAHKFDAVFNLAARAGVRYSILYPELYRRTNVLGEENVLQCQVKHGVKKHVVASSSSVYAGCPMPFTEDATLGKMQSPYADTKLQAELLARDYHQKHGLDVTVLRYFTVFGPAGRPDMAPFRFIKWVDEGRPIELFGDGTQARDFTYVDDIARGTILAGNLFGSQLVAPGSKLPAPSYDGARQRGDGMTGSHAPKHSAGVTAGGNPEGVSGYNVINLGGGRNPISLQTVIGFIEKALGKKAKINGQPFHAADIKETWADISKAQRLLGWSPQVTPQAGFQLAVDWHVANRSWLNDIKL